MGIQLTERDRSLFERLSEFGALSTAQCGRIAFPGIARTTVLRRLRLLEQGKWMRRSQGLPDGMAVWFLTALGANELGQPFDPVRIPGHQLAHDILLTDVRISLLKVGLGENWRSERSLKREFFEHSKREQEPRVIPDAIFSEVTGGKTHAIGLELELSGKSIQRYEKIFSRYASCPLHFIWYIVPDKSFGKRLLHYWKAKAGERNMGRLGFSLVDQITRDPARAEVFVGSKVHAIKDFFDLECTPAQRDAQGLSREAA